MEIRLDNSLIIGGTSSKFQLAPPIQGLACSDIRTGSGLYAGRDLGFVSGQFLGYRTIVINGFVIGTDCQDTQQQRSNLFSTLRIRKSYEIAIIGVGSSNYLARGYLTNMKGDITNPKAFEFQLTFLCPDPLLYILKANQYDWNGTKYAYTISGASGTSITVQNQGSMPSPWRWSWSGAIPTPTLTLDSTGEYFKASGMPSGTTIIDSSSRLMTVNGALANAYIDPTTVWWSLPPGTSTITYSTTASGSTSSQFLYWKGVLGI